MRSVLVASVFVCLCAALASAETPAPPAVPQPTDAAAPAAPFPKSGHSRSAPDISRADYIERAVERAKHNAEKRFDKLDTNHDGMLTADERRAARDQRAEKRAQRSTAAPQ